MTISDISKILEITIWPLFFLVAYLINRKKFNELINILFERIKGGSSFKISSIEIGAVPSSLPTINKGELITENHLGIVHTSWRYPVKDKEFNKKMFVIQIIIQGNEKVLDEIEFVEYKLHYSYPNPIQRSFDRNSKFQLKELAWGEFNLIASVKIKNQNDLIKLKRYINLTETGQNLFE
ncbi:hypothetical protein HNP38_001076 [Chryseobacterium defluvii]|uniref:Prokaryotic YEATS domain-containing protein n=1 Tax=Chryseobacterium defluvii TaxID=160396 RepID=A0A840KDF5_9FLAO|nr:pYEATS domain-containing protein [Chryseobacterium defluvii]MBB4805804.1 hypothetical protein [Chryseobacterium defluvii]